MSRSYFLTNSALAQTYISGATASYALAASAGSGTVSDSIAAFPATKSWAWSSPSNEPDSADWPAASAGDPFQVTFEVTSTGGNIQFGGSSGTQVRVHRANSALSTSLDSDSAPINAITGTGLKTCTNTTWDSAAGSASDRAGFYLLVSNSSTMQTQSFTITLSSNATYTGPWAAPGGGGSAMTDPMGMSGFFGG